jgi:ribosomal protein S18 acetylase RimI-like enzyme
MSAVFDWLKKDRGNSGCWLIVAGDNSALRFYQPLGFMPKKLDPAVGKEGLDRSPVLSQ